MKKKALGRGLEALIPERASSQDVGQRIFRLEVDRIATNRYQPRQTFDDQGISDLAESIQTHGVIQPVLVRSLQQGGYELIAGERRLRAVRLLGLPTIPAIVQEATDERSLELALIENIQREDLNPLETAEAYHRLGEDFHLSQEDIAHKVGKDRSTVANALRILTLPKEVKEEIASGRLSMGHAKALLSLSRGRDQVDVAARIVEKGLSVREAETLVRGWTAPGTTKRPVLPDPHVQDVEERMQRALGTKVRIQGRGKRGRIVVEYYGLEDLQRILEVIGA
jgi:ParB family chromosome partitioning protein